MHPTTDNLRAVSDDTYLMVWDVATARRRALKLSGHSDNIFSARFLPYSGNKEIVSVAADGEVRWHLLDLADRLGGGVHNPRSSVGSRVLARHEGRAHRLCLLPGSASRFLSCGEDGAVFAFDLREPRKTKLLTLTDEDGDALPIYALSIDPSAPYNFVVGGTAAAVSLFDARRLPTASGACEPAATYAPGHMRGYGRGRGAEHVTGVAYSGDGAEIVATYNDGCIYRFDIAGDAVPAAEGACVSCRRPLAGQQGGGRRRRVRARREGEEEEEEDMQRISAIERQGYEEGRRAALAMLRRGGEEVEEEEEEDSEEEEEEEEEEEAAEDEARRGYRMKYEGHRNDRTVKQVGEKSWLVFVQMGRSGTSASNTQSRTFGIRAASCGARSIRHSYSPLHNHSKKQNRSTLWARAPSGW